MAGATRCVGMSEPTGAPAGRPSRAILAGASLLILALAGVVLALSHGGVSNATVAGRPPAPCTVEVRSLKAASGSLRGARGGAVVCLAGGSYTGTLTLSGSHTRPVTLRPAPGATVRVGPVAIDGGAVTVEDLWIRGEVSLAAGVTDVSVIHDDITGGAEGLVFDASNCRAPNAPIWPGCEPTAPISDVTISGDRFHDIGQGTTEDAIHIDNWRNLTVTGNEFERIIESGNHTDCLQSVFGGTNLTFTRNYEHDNDCQGIFIKDGDATNVTVSDNLFVRDAVGPYANFAQLWNVRNLVVEHNTIWDGKGLALVADNPSFAPTATIGHNVLAHFVLEPATGDPYSLIGGENIFGAEPGGLRLSAGDRVVPHPRFKDPVRGDYRLAHNPEGIGINWVPAAQHYGPLG